MISSNFQPMTPHAVEEIIQTMRFDTSGLVAAIAQSDAAPYEVLMVAWMNAESLVETLTTGRVCYYSRSRKALWRKGETSGQHQTLVSASLDCDRDAVLLRVIQHGVACHTGRRSCFYLSMTPQGIIENAAPQVFPEELYKALSSAHTAYGPGARGTLIRSPNDRLNPRIAVD